MTGSIVRSPESLLLPADYVDLEPLLGWALETEGERHAKRRACTIDQTRVLYDEMAPRMDAIISLLDQIPRSESLAIPERNLYLLALSFIEVSFPIDLGWPKTENEGTYASTRLDRPHRS